MSNKTKIMVFGGLFLFAILLILAGFLFGGKKSGKSGTIDTEITEDLKNKPLAKGSTATIPDSGLVKNQIADIFKMKKEKTEAGEQEVVLKQKVLGYELRLPKGDLDNLKVEESYKNDVTSIAFYYETDGVKAFVFGINNYPTYVWTDVEGGTDDVVITQTPIRVLTYALASDNPFEDGTEDSKNYLAYVDKVPSYVQTFRMLDENGK